MSEYELYHHGVKGMKWGVRKKRDSSSGGKSSRKTTSDKSKSSKGKTALKVGAAVAATAAAAALAAYAGKNYHDLIRDRHTQICIERGFNAAKKATADWRRDRLNKEIERTGHLPSAADNKFWIKERIQEERDAKYIQNAIDDERRLSKKDSFREAWRNVRDYDRKNKTSAKQERERIRRMMRGRR